MKEKKKRNEKKKVEEMKRTGRAALDFAADLD